MIKLQDTYSTTNEDTQFEFWPANNDPDAGRFDRCSFKIKARGGNSNTFLTVQNMMLEADSNFEEGDKWYLNFRGHYGQGEFKDFNNLYDTILAGQGFPIVSMERANLYSNIMSHPVTSNSDDTRVYSVEE